MIVWIDAVASSAESNLIAFACGKDVRVIDARDAKFARTFTHERSVANLAFDAKGNELMFFEIPMDPYLDAPKNP